jgi:DnaK suppressor protein
MSAPELTQKQIEQLRGLLIDKRRELETQLTDAADATKPVTLDQQSVGRVSRIDAIQQQQMAIAGQQQASKISQQIEIALRRIDDGEYGYCGQCGESIGFARLQAQPFAAMCLQCQSDSEGR